MSTAQQLVKPKLTSALLAEKMMVLFKKHIGHGKGISRQDLFKTLYGVKYKSNSYEHFYKVDLMRKALHHLRVYSTCFVTSYRDEEGEMRYAVVSNVEEAEHYCDVLNKNIKRMQMMKIRARRSVNEKWYEKPFEWRHGINP